MTDDLGRALVAADQALGDALAQIESASLDELLGALDLIKGLRKSVATVGSDVEHRAGVVMGDKRVTVNGVEWERSKSPRRSQWQTDDLKRAVLDTRLVDNEGVIADESPLDKVLHVWNLGAPRLTALKERGIDADEFCSVSWDSDLWRVARVADKKARRK